jgi:hypothetical protein
VIVDHPDGLHKCVTDRRPDKVETALFQVFAYGIGLRRSGWDLSQGFP